MTPEQAADAIGQRVVYRSHSGTELHGEIRYAAGRYVFVRYDRDTSAKATAPELLELEAA